MASADESSDQSTCRTAALCPSSRATARYARRPSSFSAATAKSVVAPSRVAAARREPSGLYLRSSTHDRPARVTRTTSSVRSSSTAISPLVPATATWCDPPSTASRVTATADAANPTRATRVSARVASRAHTSPLSHAVKNTSGRRGCQHAWRTRLAWPLTTTRVDSDSGWRFAVHASHADVPTKITSDPEAQSMERIDQEEATEEEEEEEGKDGADADVIVDGAAEGSARGKGSVIRSPSAPSEASHCATAPSAPPVSRTSTSGRSRIARTPPPHATVPSGWIVRGPRACARTRRNALPLRQRRSDPSAHPPTTTPAVTAAPPSRRGGGFRNSTARTSSTPNSPKDMAREDQRRVTGSSVHILTCFLPHVQNRSPPTGACGSHLTP